MPLGPRIVSEELIAQYTRDAIRRARRAETFAAIGWLALGLAIGAGGLALVEWLA